ncbi:MAG TPA: thioredoxin family protein [Thermoplasmata archaeon]|nr:thioredoxin family protein [Thermoplasmata archaeon]
MHVKVGTVSNPLDPVPSLPLLGSVGKNESPALPIGEAGPPFTELAGVDGQRHGIGSFAQSRVLVLAFLGNACPAAKGLLPELTALQLRYRSQGVQVVAINPNNPHLSPRDSLEEMIRFAEEHGLNFPYLKDPDGSVARTYGARNTPHFVVLDSERKLRYRGRMFDSREPARATQRDLDEVLGALLAGRPVARPETSPLGCGIVW